MRRVIKIFDSPFKFEALNKKSVTLKASVSAFFNSTTEFHRGTKAELILDYT